MRSLIVSLGICLVVSGCSDTIVSLQKTKSPNGDVKADYVKVLYGGAAGGVTYCVNLEYGDKREECAIAAIHVESGDVRWSGRKVTFRHCGGTVTNNEAGLRHPEAIAPFLLSVVEDCQRLVQKSMDSGPDTVRPNVPLADGVQP